MNFNLNNIISKNKVEQYSRRIQFLKKIKKWDTSNIEQTVEEVHKNVLSKGCQALVLYGEPQSGKTETMIALTAKLLDSGKKHILLLVTDHVQLRDQNLREFAMSGLSPTPQTNKDFLRDIKENNLATEKSRKRQIICDKNLKKLFNLNINDNRIGRKYFSLDAMLMKEYVSRIIYGNRYDVKSWNFLDFKKYSQTVNKRAIKYLILGYQMSKSSEFRQIFVNEILSYAVEVVI